MVSFCLYGYFDGAAWDLVRQDLYLQFFKNTCTNRTELLLPFLMTGTGITMSLVTDVSQMPFIRFDSYLLFAEYAHIGKLLLTYLLFFIPFFLGALAIGLVFVKMLMKSGKFILQIYWVREQEG